MENKTFAYLTQLIWILLLYKVFTISLTLSILLLIWIALFLLRMYLKHPQVPFSVKFKDFRFRINFHILGVYTGKFSLMRYKIARAFLNVTGMSPPPLTDPKNAHITEIKVPSLIDDYQIPMKVYIRKDHFETEKQQPIMFMLFGGGFQVESPMWGKEIFMDLGMMVVKIQYRLAPDYKFPVAWEDTYSCLSFIAKRGHQIFKQWDSRLILYGTSAGGNLATINALFVRDRGLKLNVISQVLGYPAMFYLGQCKSHEEYKDWYLMDEKKVSFVDQSLLRDEKDYENPYLCPIKQENLKGLPPAYFILSERDYFCSECELYYEKLKEQGNQAICKIYPIEHGFLNGPSLQSGRAFADLVEHLKKRLEETK